jgi:hypothetical protein
MDECEELEYLLECLDDSKGDCEGPIELRMALSASGRSFPRCEKHWGERLDEQDRINERYPEHPPSDWSPLDAGESWYEDE